MPASNPAPLAVADIDPGVAATRSAFGRFAPIAIAFALAFAILSLGIAAPFEKDAESQSAQWVVDIAHNGNWLLPHDYYDFVERKPPLFYWLGAIGVKLSGGAVNEARARMPSLYAGAALAALVMDWAAADLGAAGGWLAFFFLLGMYGFAVRATVALTDMLMTFCLIAAWRIIRAQLDGMISWPRTISAGLVLGLGVLVKGPVIAVLIACATVLYLAMCRSNPLRLATRVWPWAWFAIAFAVAAAWYVPAFIAGRSSAWGGVFIDENFGHFLPARLGGTGEAARPLYYIVMRLLGGMMPLSFLLPALALAFAERAFAPPARRAMLCQLALALAVIVLFSASSAKRDDYILPAIPPFAILFAALFTGAIAAPANGGAAPDGVALRAARYAPIVRDLTAVAIAFVMLLGVAATIFFARAGASLDTLRAHLQSSDASFAAIFLTGMSHLRPTFVAFATAVAIGATVAVSGFARNAPVRTGGGLAILCLAGSMLWTGVLKPQVARTRSLRPFAAEVKARVGAAPLYLAFIDPEFAWYYGSGVPPLPRPIAKSDPDPGAAIYFVARPNELVRLAPPIRSALILVLPSSVLGGNPPSLYLLESPAKTPPRRAAHRHRHWLHSGRRAPSSPPSSLNGRVPSVK
jgi:4-amino-4-deoxy-L-arabinose transferase-like glycosyltransferase